MRDELLNGEIFYSLKEAQVLIEMWRKHFNKLQFAQALLLAIPGIVLVSFDLLTSYCTINRKDKFPQISSNYIIKVNAQTGTFKLRFFYDNKSMRQFIIYQLSLNEFSYFLLTIKG